MAEYDYRSGKKRIEDILENELDVLVQDRLPSDENLTYKNAYDSWVTGFFVDIRDSSTLFSQSDKKKVSRVIRSFTSEVIEILRKEDSLREIGIRGDCVYAIYTTDLKTGIHDIVNLAFYIYTFMSMLTKLLEKKSLPTIRVGIGISTARELVIKAGRKDTGINNKVWIGDAVTKASNLSSLGSKGGYSSIVMSGITYDNIIEILVNNNGEVAKTWFTSRYDAKLGTHYDCNVIKMEFNNWIDGGMPD